ncbi:uncharacterized protein LOC121418666 [Lytechinus variegatus]|uniref:uncharacterized protein LOC121418666 n=1 Tax=Lytechinus variegatus TaxID=7654 RepID=UPI001BB1A54D|nr:uncharacterized protein LOC121418666 [Lytechinus variegatus]
MVALETSHPFVFVLMWKLLTYFVDTGQGFEVVERDYEIPISADTFLHGPLVDWGMNDYLEIGQRADGIESRSLLTFDIGQFMLESQWGQEDRYPNINQSTILRTSLSLSCTNIENAGSTDPFERNFQDTLHVGRLLVPWEEDVATSVVRANGGQFWEVENVGTDGTDATASVASASVDITYAACQEGASVSFDITDTLLSWINGSSPNYGLVIWAEDAMLTRKWIKFVSSGSHDVVNHPVLAVTIQDTLVTTPGEYSFQNNIFVNFHKINIRPS